MANYIKVAVRNSILTLFERGWSQRKIARELGIHRETVARYIRIEEASGSKPAISTAGNDPLPRSKPAISTAGNNPPPRSKPAISTAPMGHRGRKSLCEPYRRQVERGLEVGLSAQRIFQDLRFEYDFPGTYESVKRFVRRLKRVHPKRVYRLESPPGEEAQVDFGRGAPILGEDGRKKYPHVLRVSLSYSRKSYSECVLRQTAEVFIRCLENAFRAFGGVPHTVTPDNLKAAVTKADWFDPDLNPKIESFARYYGTVIMPTRPNTPQDKGKIESGIKYVKNNALKGRVFSSLEEENKHLRWWEETVADCRIHGTTRKQVGKLFAEDEKSALLPLPTMLFPCFQEGERRVHRDGYVEVDKAYYQVPEEYIGRKIWVRWDSRLVRVFNRNFEQITVLSRIPAGKFSSCLSTRGRKTSVECTAAYWLKRASLIGDCAGKWAFEVVSNRGPQGIRVLQGLIGMTRKYSYREIEKACELAVSHGAYRLRDLRRLIKEPSRQETFEFMASHPLIRDMGEYGDFFRGLQTIQQHETEKEVLRL